MEYVQWDEVDEFPSRIYEDDEIAIRILDEISPRKEEDDFDNQLDIGTRSVLHHWDEVKRTESPERMDDVDFRRIQEGANMVVSSMGADRRLFHEEEDVTYEDPYAGLSENVAAVLNTLDAENFYSTPRISEEIRRGAEAVINEINRLHEEDGISYVDLYEGLDENVAALLDALDVETEVFAGSPSRFSAFGSPKSPEKDQESKKVYTELEAQYEEMIQKITASPRKEYGPDVGLLEADTDLDGTNESISRGSHHTPERGGKGDEEDLTNNTVKTVMDNVRQKEDLEKSEKQDCERMMDSYKKLINGSPKDQERLEKEQINFVESLIDVGRRRYLLLLAFKFSQLMDLRENAGDQTDYTSLLKLFVAGYFYPERFRRRKIHSEGQKFGAEWIKQVDALMDHAMLANPDMTKQEAFLGSVNEAWERTKKHRKEVLQEMAEESVRAEDDILEEKERWGKRWLRQLDILITATILNSKIPVTGRRVHLVANKPMDLDKTYVMDVRTVVEWERFQDFDWKNIDDEEGEALVTTAMELLEARFHNDWRANVKLAVEYLDTNHGLEHLERVLKVMGVIAKDEVKHFEPELSAMIVFVHRYIQKERGLPLPDLITDPEQLLNESQDEGAIQRLYQDHEDVSRISKKGAAGFRAMSLLLQQAHEDGGNIYLEMIMMSMAWPDEFNRSNPNIYDAMMAIHDYILLK